MADFQMDGLRVSGIAASVPKKVVENRDYEFMPENERDLFMKTTGIERRRIAPNGMKASDLCLAAANKLIEELGWVREEIGVLIFITQTPDYLIPPTSNTLQHRMNLPKSCVALDINLGCSGYPYGMAVAGSLMKTFNAQKGLLLVGDVSSSCISSKDKSTAPIFSDAGSATALQLDKKAAAMHYSLNNDGSGFDTIIIPDGGMQNPFSEKSLKEEKLDGNIIRRRIDLIMNGVDVFNFAVREVVPNIRNVWEMSGTESEEVDYYVLHQANKIMLDSIRKKLAVEKEKMPYSLKDFGNTSSASIPVTLITELREKLRSQRMKLMLSGFGVGLSWGSVLLETGQIICPPLIEL